MANIIYHSDYISDSEVSRPCLVKHRADVRGIRNTAKEMVAGEQGPTHDKKLRVLLSILQAPGVWSIPAGRRLHFGSSRVVTIIKPSVRNTDLAYQVAASVRPEIYGFVVR